MLFLPGARSKVKDRRMLYKIADAMRCYDRKKPLAYTVV
jgi:hypothetical protein